MKAKENREKLKIRLMHVTRESNCVLRTASLTVGLLLCVAGICGCGSAAVANTAKNSAESLSADAEAAEMNSEISDSDLTTPEDGYILHEETVTISGLANTYDFLMLTDMHLVIKTQDYLNEQLGNADDRIAAFSNSNGTTAADEFTYWVDYANANAANLDGFLMLGDMIDYYSDENVAYFVNGVNNLQIPYLYSIGNHEEYSPWGDTVPGDSDLYSLFGNGNVTGDKNYQIWEFDDLVLCAINDETYEVNYYGTLGVEEAQKLGKPIILILHVPLCNENTQDLIDLSAETWGHAIVTGPGALGDTGSTNELLDSITAEDSNVVAVFSGDNHFYYKGQLSDHVTEWVLDPAFFGNATHLKVSGGES